MISNATIISSLRIKAVNEMDTMWRNSVSNSTSDIIMIAAPNSSSVSTVHFPAPDGLTLVKAYHTPLEKRFV